MKPGNARCGKRQQAWEEEESEVDDLAVAATFAQITASPPTQQEQQVHSSEQEDAAIDDNSSGDESEGSEESDNVSNSNIMDESKGGGENDETDESDVDEFEEEELHSTSKTGTVHAPTTEHEVDPYRMPLSDLETKFQLNLTVAEQERLRVDKETDVPATGPVQLCAAGHVKCHVVEDRTIVVESVATGGSAPLDEGSLLVIRVPNENDEKTKSRLMPLGKVFEVFGPVSRPLYTIRLPSTKDKPSVTENKPKSEAITDVERDADEIPLDDDGGPAEYLTENKAKEVKPVPDNNGGTEEQNDNDGGHDARTVDQWAPNGKCTKLLESSERMAVYYIPDITKLLDTGAVIRNSGRGCDASNLYDEEVVDVNDMEFSDDEQEREFKNRHKRGKKDRKRNRGGNASSGRGRTSSGSGYTGFHVPQYAVYPSNQSVQYSLPPENHPMQYQTADGGYPYPQPYGYPHQQLPYPQGSYPYSQGAIPPPPHYLYPLASNRDSGGQPGDEPSDTVYYD